MADEDGQQETVSEFLDRAEKRLGQLQKAIEELTKFIGLMERLAVESKELSHLLDIQKKIKGRERN